MHQTTSSATAIKSGHIWPQGLARQVVLHLFSFELLFALFCFSGTWKMLLPLPEAVDATVLFFALSAYCGFFLLFRVPTSRAIGLLFPLFLLVVYAMASLIWTPGQYGQEKFLRFAIITTWCAVGSALIISRDAARVRRFLVIILFISIFVAIQSLGDIFGSNRRVMIEGYLGRGRLIGVGTVIAIWGVIYLRSLRDRLAATAVAIPVATALVLTSSRGPNVAAAIALLLPAALVFRPHRGGGIVISPRLVAPALAVVIGLGVISYQEASGNQLLLVRRMQLAADQADRGAEVAGRTPLYRIALEQIDKTFVGHGFGAWSYVVYGEDRRGYPHNIFLELGVELGLIGLLLFLWLLLVCIRNLRSPWELTADPLKLLITMLLVQAFVNALVSGDLNDNRLLFCLMGLTVYCGATSHTAKRPLVAPAGAEAHR